MSIVNKIVTILFFATHAAAAAPAEVLPKVGDWVKIEQIRVISGVRYTTQWTQTVQQTDAAGEQFLITWVSSSGEATEYWQHHKAMLYNNDIVDMCVKENFPTGFEKQLERVNTPAGDFAACRLSPGENHYVWITSEVPFGFVKAQVLLPNGDRTEQVVTEYHRNN